MTPTEQTTLVTVDLADGCAKDHCLKMAWELKHQLDPDYIRGAATMRLDGTYAEYRDARRTARRRAGHAERLGYTSHLIERSEHQTSIHEINTSKPVRQGRPMSAGYQEMPTYGPNPRYCDRHYVYTYGVMSPQAKLVAYLWLYRSGELALVSTILGHADHLEDDVMYLLYLSMLQHQWLFGGVVFYNRWNSGTDGLRFFKERVGLAETDVEWRLL